ncbi:ribose ABC transporter substrate-binding protein RbsB [Symbiobacterium thermophilum]|uniref:Ribose import binding protein RbsB n=1 Tax=Symbiobacterium thermophilum TaxID=2734 RepID=A0A953I436_SYMTR|nr:ribose ABC transporter substrate-binding protein RbsB [Symbiobacterium thermophilum]MBY6277200.1 ribose ABC transporter substrate-binding protein RbsB [Symbiobacterium thermophilum]
MKRFAHMLVALLTIGALTACSGGGSTPSGQTPGTGTGTGTQPAPATEPAPAPEKTLTLGLAISTLNNPFFVDLRDGAQAAADAAGVKLVVMDAQDDPSKQISQVEDLITQKVDALLINPTDSDAIVTAVEAANEANIPVFTVDRGANGGKVVAHIASDNVLGGRMAGELIVELIGGQGQVAELEGIPGASAARDRGQGFHEAVDGVQGIDVVASQPADFDRAKGLTVMENILQAHPDIVAVFAHNDEMALGALEAIEAAGKADQIKVVGFDATDDAVKAVQEGRMAATVAQKPKEMGRLGVETALKHLNGEKVDEYIPVPLELVTK